MLDVRNVDTIRLANRRPRGSIYPPLTAHRERSAVGAAVRALAWTVLVCVVGAALWWAFIAAVRVAPPRVLDVLFGATLAGLSAWAGYWRALLRRKGSRRW